MNRFTPHALAFENADGSHTLVSLEKPLPVYFADLEVTLQPTVQIDQTTPNANDVNVKVRSKVVTRYLDAVIIVGSSAVHDVGAVKRTMQASIAGTGALTGTVTWYGSNISGQAGYTIATMTLDCNDSKVCAAQDDYEWPFVWAELTDLSGTGATVTATLAA